MGGYEWAPLAWIVLLAAAWPYVRRARHPAMGPVVAYLIFVVAFSAMAAVLFGMATSLLASMSWADMLAHPLTAVPLLALVFAPSFLLGRWLIQRQPRRAPLPGE
jgi:uncharacterized protein (DUF2062 family)